MENDSSEIGTLVERLGQVLAGRGETVTTAESCTGGWVAKVLTDRAGSSEWFGYGLVTYSNQAKVGLLGVNESLIARHGAVSGEVVSAMANGALKVSGADWAVAISGVAGPGGGTADKPVGLVWLAWAGANGLLEAESHHYQGDRAAVRQQAVVRALAGLLERVAS